MTIQPIPHRSVLARRRVRPGNCLNHFRILADLPRPNGYLLCQGPVLHPVGRFLHCWLEYEEIVVDLTRRYKFFPRDFYYDQSGIEAATVRRYTLETIYGSSDLFDQGLTFWGFDLTEFLSR